MPLLPADLPLDEQTVALTKLLGSSNPHERESEGYRTLAGWISQGVYDDLLVGLGDGMTAGLLTGLGEMGSTTVFRRSWSAKVLADCIVRDNVAHLLTPGQLMVWADKIATWLLREQDLRGVIDGHGNARAVAHGAEAIGALALSRYVGGPELGALLDVIAERLLIPTSLRFVAGEQDALARATVAIFSRGLVGISDVEAWSSRLVDGCQTLHPDSTAAGRSWNTQMYLRSLSMRVSLGQDRLPERADLALVLVSALRRTNPDLRTVPEQRNR